MAAPRRPYHDGTACRVSTAKLIDSGCKQPAPGSLKVNVTRGYLPPFNIFIFARVSRRLAAGGQTSNNVRPPNALPWAGLVRHNGFTEARNIDEGDVRVPMAADGGFRLWPGGKGRAGRKNDHFGISIASDIA
jgi:hypothetical protein